MKVEGREWKVVSLGEDSKGSLDDGKVASKTIKRRMEADKFERRF
jgi:hypothetical protein